MAVLRTATKKKTAVSVARSAKVSARRKSVTKAQLIENSIKTNLTLDNLAISDPCVLDTNKQSWLRCFDGSPFSYVPYRLAQLATTKKKKKKLFVWIQVEAMPDTTPFPILVVAQTLFPPTERIAVTSIQNGTEEYMSFAESGLLWEEVTEGVFGLKSSNDDQFKGRGWSLPILTSSQVENEEPRVVTVVSIQYQGNEIDWNTELETIDELVEDDESMQDLSNEEKNQVKELLLEEKNRLEVQAQATVASNQENFAQMIDSIAAAVHGATADQVKDNLDTLCLYKLYPMGLPEPQATAFGASGGVQKTTKINRFCNAGRFFDS